MYNGDPTTAPMCEYCQRDTLVRVHRHWWERSLSRLTGRLAYRCRVCGWRGMMKPLPAAPSLPMSITSPHQPTAPAVGRIKH
jgi:DNA-directed RNA polymerase subunit RPC12/RpoP